MPDAKDLLLARQDRLTRPVHYEELLLEPITDSEGQLNEFGSYRGWEEDHAVGKRFYVAGIRWLTETTGLTQTAINNVRARAPAQVTARTSWNTMHDPKGFWNERLGQPQVRHAFNVEPMPFAKAAQLLMACELAVEDIIEGRLAECRVPEEFESAERIHGFMGILPACYNIDDFSSTYLEEVRAAYPEALGELRQAAGLRTAVAISDLAKGMTVTRQTASAVQEHAKKTFRIPNNHIGLVRARPGRYLGSGHATEKEDVNVR